MLLRTLLIALTLAGVNVPDMAKAQQPPPSSERMALAMKLLDAMDYDSVVIADPTGPSPLPTAPNRGAMAALREFREKYVTSEQLKPVHAAEYAKRFTEDELRQLTAFYESQLGARFRRAQLELGPALNAAITAIYAAYQAEFQQMLTRHLTAP